MENMKSIYEEIKEKGRFSLVVENYIGDEEVVYLVHLKEKIIKFKELVGNHGVEYDILEESYLNDDIEVIINRLCDILNGSIADVEDDSYYDAELICIRLQENYKKRYSTEDIEELLEKEDNLLDLGCELLEDSIKNGYREDLQEVELTKEHVVDYLFQELNSKNNIIKLNTNKKKEKENTNSMKLYELFEIYATEENRSKRFLIEDIEEGNQIISWTDDIGITLYDVLEGEFACITEFAYSTDMYTTEIKEIPFKSDLSSKDRLIYRLLNIGLDVLLDDRGGANSRAIQSLSVDGFTIEDLPTDLSLIDEDCMLLDFKNDERIQLMVDTSSC